MAQDEQAVYHEAERDPRVRAVLHVLAPPHKSDPTFRCPIFEWGHETTPTAEEMVKLAREIVFATNTAEDLT